MPIWLQALAVAAGGAAGSVARFAVSKASASYLGTAFPYGTLIVNAAGSLLLGVLIGFALGRSGAPAALTLLVGVGFCGAFTTFSTFAVETLANRAVGLAVLNIVLNNLVSIGLAALGLYMGVRAYLRAVARTCGRSSGAMVASDPGVSPRVSNPVARRSWSG